MELTSSLNGTKEVISIVPDGKVDFGVISNGFIYRLTFQVQNNLLSPIKIRVVHAPIDVNEANTLKLLEMPSKIAPGMVLTLKLELTAEHVCTSLFKLIITQDCNDIVVQKIVQANVVSIDTFKHVKKSLQLQKRPVYRHNVEVVGNTPEFEMKMTASMINSVASNTSLVMLDNDELEDMMMFPIAQNIYWDPFEKCMRIDPKLGKVFADGKTKTKKALRKTIAIKEKRSRQLEEQGFLTFASLKAMKNDRKLMGVNSLFSSFAADDESDDISRGSQDVDPADDATNNSHANSSVQSIKTTRKDSDDEEDSADDEDLISELIKQGQKEVIGKTPKHHSLAIGEDDASLGESGAVGNTSELLDGVCRMSVTGILAMKRSKRERIERQRKATVNASMDFSKMSESNAMVDSQRTLNMINARIKGVKALSLDESIK